MHNSNLSDVNELYFTHVLNNETWPSRESELKYKQSVKKISLQDWRIQTGRAGAMAKSVVKQAKIKGYKNLESVHWVARGSLQKVVDSLLGKNTLKINPRNNPTDVLLKFKTGPSYGLLGISMKSTSRPSTTFKNRSIGALDDVLNSKIGKVEDDLIKLYSKQYNLPEVMTQRKTELQKSKNKKLAEEMGNEALKGSRDSYLKLLRNMDDDQILNHLLSFWMDASDIFPPYLTVKGSGNEEGKYKATVEDALKRTVKITTNSKDFKVVALGDFTIGFSKGSERLCTVRFKYRDTKFASPIKLSAEPWK